MLTLVGVISQLLRACARLGALLQQFELGSVDLSQADVLGLHLQPALRLQKKLIAKYISAGRKRVENAVRRPQRDKL